MKAFKSLRATAHLDVWIGVVLMVVGVVLLFVAWAQTASRTDVAYQIPWVISAGFTGLGFVVLGLTVVNLAAKRAQARDRERQTEELRRLLGELRGAIDATRNGE